MDQHVHPDQVWTCTNLPDETEPESHYWRTCLCSCGTYEVILRMDGPLPEEAP